MIAIDNVKKSCLYIEDCRDWYRKASTEKTWANFKVHFVRAFKETRKSTKTNQAGGYTINVDRDDSRAVMFSEMQQDHTEALENLVTATKSDREAVSLLTKTISELTSQETTLT